MNTNDRPCCFDRRLFRPVETAATGDATAATIFRYHQNGDVVRADYDGGPVRAGQLLGLMRHDGSLDARYQHADRHGSLKTGVCRTTVEWLPDGRVRLHEQWQWTCGDLSSGTSILEEVQVAAAMRVP